MDKKGLYVKIDNTSEKNLIELAKRAGFVRSEKGELKANFSGFIEYLGYKLTIDVINKLKENKKHGFKQKHKDTK